MAPSQAGKYPGLSFYSHIINTPPEIQENREKPAHRKKDIALYRDEAASMIDEDLKASWYKAMEFNKAKAAELELWFKEHVIPSVAALDAVKRTEVKAEAEDETRSERGEAESAVKDRAGPKEKANALRAKAGALRAKAYARRAEADAQQAEADALMAEADELDKVECEAEADAPGQGQGPAEENCVVS
jgi:hypothetical protein